LGTPSESNVRRDEPTDQRPGRALRTGRPRLLDAVPAYWLCVSIAMVSGTALRWDAMQGSLLADDWDHYAMQAGIYPVARGKLDLFNFVAADAAERRALLGTGRLPWWTAPDIHLAVLRPLSSALLYLDYRVLDGPHHPRRPHLHSWLWWLLLMAAVASLLGSVLPLPAAALGVLIYALDDAHVLPVTWSANRSELIAIALVIWGLVAHVAARKRGFRAGRPIALLLVALGLLAGEHALGPLAYFVAFELVAGEGCLRRRLAALAPLAALVVAYLMLRTGLGYGLAGSSFYIDPLAEPLRYMSASAKRLPLLLADLAFEFAAEWQYWEPPWYRALLELHWFPPTWVTLARLQQIQPVLGLLAAALASIAAWRLCRAPVAHPRRAVGWLLLGGLLALLPMCGALPMGRLTLAAAVGFDAALGWLLWRLCSHVVGSGVLPARVGAVLAASSLIALHVVYASARSLREVSYYALRSRLEEQWVLHAELPDAELAGKNVIVVSSADWASQFFLPFVRHLHRRTLPASSEVLSAASGAPHQLLRVAPRVLDLRLPAAPSGNSFSNSAYRSESARFRAGEWYPGPRFNVAIVATADGQPIHLRFVFPVSLDDARYVFLYPTTAGLVRLQLPRVGEQLSLPAPAWPSFAQR
jgi:hypothetical protein